jgi:hypothetical protein
MIAEFKIKDLLPNPFRRVEHYPINRQKIEALKESFQATTFWDNLVARPKGNKAEIAYGEHRRNALNEYYGENHKVTVSLRDLSDEQMLKIMARENMEEWSVLGGLVVIETVHSVVLAYAAGQIKLPPPDGAMRHRYAPSFIPAANIEKSTAKAISPFSAQTIAKFLGWVTPEGIGQHKVDMAVTALQFIEQGMMTEDDFEGLGVTDCEIVIEKTRKTYNENRKNAEAARERQERAEKELGRAKKRIAQAKTSKEKEEALIDKRFATEKLHVAEKDAEKFEVRTTSLTTRVGKAISGGLKSGKIGRQQAENVRLDIVGKESKELPNINKAADRINKRVYEFLRPDFDMQGDRLEEIVEYRDSLSAETRRFLVLSLLNLAARAKDFAQQLTPSGSPEKFVHGLKETHLLKDVAK